MEKQPMPLRRWVTHPEYGYSVIRLLWVKKRKWWRFPFDCHLIRYPVGSSNPAHQDRLKTRRHFRMNIVLWAAEGGEFTASQYIFRSRRVNVFRPDIAEHSVSKVTKGTRVVLSFGWTNGPLPESEREAVPTARYHPG
jgi:hypothetical protein